jgi:hypothetical protein
MMVGPMARAKLLMSIVLTAELRLQPLGGR